MIGKFKKYFGIEGLKIELELEDVYDRSKGLVYGIIRLDSMNAEEVKNIKIKLIEKYTRGRKKSKLIDEYILGELFIEGPIDILPGEVSEVPFEFEFQEHLSEMDHMERSNFVFGGMVKIAKLIKNASSDFRLEVQADVKGTKFNPFVKQPIQLS